MTGNSGWDVVFPTHSRLAPMARNGLIANLDHARLPSLGNLDARFQQPAMGSRICAGAFLICGMRQASRITARRRLSRAAGRALESGSARTADDAGRSRRRHRRMPAEARLSVRLDRRKPAAGGQGRRRSRQKKLLRAYLNAEVRDQLVSGDVLAAQIWSTTAAQAIREMRNSASFIPRKAIRSTATAR